ncbi:MAG: glycosyltransferase [bacterium]
MDGISVVYSTRKQDKNFYNHINESSGLNSKNIEILCYENPIGEKGLSEIYNESINSAKFDIIVFIHDDIYFESYTSNWGERLLSIFDEGYYDIIGLAGIKRHLPESGKWWEYPYNNMIGVVNHEDSGKKWESRYSDGFGVEEAIIVDGLFIAINKNQIKHKFDERFKFHFYDIGFCFPNYLDGCNIGVTYDIRVTHKSVGRTNDEWEKSREEFVKLYSKELPYKIPTNIKLGNSNKKPKILISCLNFNSYTGSELYNYELSKELKQMGCDVTILSNLKGGDLSLKARELGIKTLDFSEPLKGLNYDVLHIQHNPIMKNILNNNQLDLPIVTTIHSEVIDLENPILDDRIKKYIAIRPEIQEHIIKNFNIPEDRTEVVYNPIDFNRFKVKRYSRDKTVLFVGTIDFLRKNTILDLVKRANEKEFKLVFVGIKREKYLDEFVDNKTIKYFKPAWHIEKFLTKVTHTAGILLGRTTIEGWVAGLNGIIYNVDKHGNIKSITEHEPPNDIDKFNSKNVAKKIYSIYEEVI